MWLYTHAKRSSLINPKSTITGEAPIMKSTKHWFHLWIVIWNSWKGGFLWDIKTTGSQCLRTEVKSWIDSGLEDLTCSNTPVLVWGIDVPDEGAEGKKCICMVWCADWLYFIWGMEACAEGRQNLPGKSRHEVGSL
jgi:methionyl-tRNA synthetase